MHALFITGTGTGVGKTVVSTALCLALAKRRLHTVYIKPVQTGCEGGPGEWRAPDLLWAGERFARVKARSPIEGLVLCGYRTPCSPHLAARLEDHPLPYAAMIKAARHLIEEAPAAVVEGAGGVLTPLDDTRTWLDVGKALKLPAVVVAHTGLGTLNHTRLTVDALRRARIPVAGIVLTQPEAGPWGEIERDNAATLPRFTGAPVLGVLRHQKELTGPRLARFGEELLNALAPA
jgi:dethiobiotin synthase